MPEIQELDVQTRKQFQAELSAEPVMNIASLGEGISLTSRRTAELDIPEATRVLELQEFAGERPLNSRHVEFLVRQMKAGAFRWELVTIATCVLDGREYRMNGQHTCWARFEMPDKYRAPASLLKYRAETEHDMRQLYASFDRGKARSSGNVVVSYLSGHEKFPHLTKQVLKMLAQGLAVWKWETDQQREIHTADDKAFLLITDNYDVANKVGTFLNSQRIADIRHIFRASSVGAMFATFNKAPEKATEFWGGVGRGEMLNANDPRYSLRNKLMGASVNSAAKSALVGKEGVTQEEIYRWCISAWNAWRQGVSLKTFKTDISKVRQSPRN